MTKQIFISLLIIGVLLSFQNTSNDERSLAIQKEIEYRLNEFRTEKQKECLGLAVKRAEEIVDSVIHKENLIPNIDTMIAPNRPIRPLKEKNIEIDTTEEVVPLFQKQQ